MDCIELVKEENGKISIGGCKLGDKPSLFCQLISIDKYDTWYRSDPKTYNLDYMDKAIVIPKEAYEEAMTIVKTTSATLLAEMKKRVSAIEKQ